MAKWFVGDIVPTSRKKGAETPLSPTTSHEVNEACECDLQTSEFPALPKDEL